jgi:hypothetical protein
MTDLPPLIEEPKILLTHEDFAAFSARMKRLQIGLDDFSGRMASPLESARDLARLPKTGAISRTQALARSSKRQFQAYLYGRR